MIRFSAFLVTVALGLLVAGVVTSRLVLVYSAIGVSSLALLALGAGAAIKWSELFGKPQPVESVVPGLGRVEARPVAASVLGVPGSIQVPAAPVRSAWPATPQPSPPGPSLAGYLPTDQPARTQQPPPRPSTFPEPSGFPEPASPPRPVPWSGATIPRQHPRSPRPRRQPSQLLSQPR